MMDMTSCFNGMFGKLGAGMCRLTMNGKIAVKTSNGYKSYNVKSGRLTNCSNFVFNIGEDFFFIIPTNKVDVGDIILIKGKPQCVIEVADKTLKVMNYEDMTIDTIVPERHVFMGNTYFYGKIVSLLGSNASKGKNGMKQMMQFMMMNQMFGGGSGAGMAAGGNNMLPMMLMMNGGSGSIFDGMLDGMFDFGADMVEDEDALSDEVDSEEDED
jgi:hypothetical protein